MGDGADSSAVTYKHETQNLFRAKLLITSSQVNVGSLSGWKKKKKKLV